MYVEVDEPGEDDFPCRVNDRRVGCAQSPRRNKVLADRHNPPLLDQDIRWAVDAPRINHPPPFNQYRHKAP